MLLVYVDDTFSQDQREMDRLKASLATKFEIKDLVLSWNGSRSIQEGKSGLSKKVHPRPSKGNRDEWMQADRHTN